MLSLLARSISFSILLSTVAHGAADPAVPSFALDVLPQLTKAGCNSGSCHAKIEGQNNFRLSVFGYDVERDHAEIVKENRGRRIFFAAPAESLFLKKATAAIPHEGGQRIVPGSEAYKIILRWLQAGAPLKTEGEPDLQGITVSPSESVVKKGSQMSLQVTAGYSNGSKRNVTALAEYVLPEKDIASVNEHGLVSTTNTSGEAVIVIRYMGKVAISRVTVPADKVVPASAYASLPVNNEIDRLAYERMAKLGLQPSETCTDEQFLRRASLDLIGKLPSPEQTLAFLRDTSPDKRTRAVDQFLKDPNYADHWAVKWGDLIRPNPSRVGVKPVLLLDQWIRSAFASNKPYDQMVRELLTAAGSTHDYGPVAILRDKREPVDAASFVSQIFLGVRLDCARCHHHPTEKWSQEDYYQMAAFFARLGRKGQGISAPISGEVEHWWPSNKGSITHPVTEAVMTPRPPDGPEMPYVDQQDPRARLADWMASSDNPFFSKAIVNRIWAEFFGRGFVEPVDDLRASNPASNEPLLNWLAQDFAAHGFDLKHLMRTIATSRLYQLSSTPNPTNLADTRNYSRSLKRRLSAEVLADAVADLTGTTDRFEGLPDGARAVKTWNHKLSSDFLDAFGRPNASQECPCDRERKSSVVQALHLMNGEGLQNRLSKEDSRLDKLLKNNQSEPSAVRDIYLAAYSRLPNEAELQTTLRYLTKPGLTRQQGLEDVMWSLINSAEFVFNH